MFTIRLLLSLFLALMLFSCKKKQDPVSDPGFKLDNGMLVLCEGLFQQNNSSISWIANQDGSITSDIFLTQIGRGLGDTGNDMIKYGGKLYVAVNVSSTIEVIDASSFKSLKQIPMSDNGFAKQPRQIIGYGSAVYVTCFDGFVDVIDTLNLNVTTRIPVGANPEGITVSNGKLYVANSGGLNYPDLDSTVSIIDPISNTELNKIVVGLNPGKIISDQFGDVYVLTRGDYGSVGPEMIRVDALNNVYNTGLSVDFIEYFGSNMILVHSGSGQKHLASFDPNSESIINPDLIDISVIQTIYGINYNEQLDRIAICDAMGYVNSGRVYLFNSNGTPSTFYHVGLNPSKVIFYE